MPDNNKGIKQLWGYDLIDSKARNAISSTRSSLENDFQKKTDDTLGTTSKTIPGAINEIKDSVDNLDGKFSVEQTDTKYDMKYNGKTIANIGLTLTDDQIAGGDGSFNIDLTPYQTKTDTSLTTTDKTISGAINEVNVQYKEMASKQEVDVERKRIDAFVKLAEGSTTGDAELLDGRIGADGITYNNIGEAIRGQMGKKVTGIGITKIMTITQEDYDYSIKDPNTLYIISDTTGESGTTQQLIPYLKNTGGNSYIDTGYVPKLNSKFELTIRDESLVSNNAYFGNQYFNMYYAGTNWAAALHGNEYTGAQLTNPSSKHTYIRNSTELYVDEQLQSTVKAGTKVDTRSLYIFGKHLADGYSTMSSEFTFFELKIYEDDTLVHHYKPKKDSSDVAGLYDIVTQQYLYNSGTGTLEYGTELEEE